jgi:serine/alanine adding enzyme
MTLAIQKQKLAHFPDRVLTVELAERSGEWDRYVESAKPESLYHRWVWREVIEESFGHRPYYLAAFADGAICGVLPLVHVRSRLFGSFLISIPFFSYGGVLADTQEARDALLARAVELGRQLKVRHIELRDSVIKPAAASFPSGWTTHSHKVTMEIELPSTADLYWKRLSSGMRNKIRQAQKHKLRAEWGGIEALPIFHQIFAVNMRNLGTPVYARQFFAEQLRRLGDRIRILTIWDDKTPVAAAFLTAHHDKLELPWSASLSTARKKYSHVFLYWTFIEKAIEEGFRKIDLGRCSPGSGTHEFKQHWNPVERPLHWVYWRAGGGPLQTLSGDNPKFKLATAIWQLLPLEIANRLGPKLVRGIP